MVAERPRFVLARFSVVGGMRGRRLWRRFRPLCPCLRLSIPLGYGYSRNGKWGMHHALVADQNREFSELSGTRRHAWRQRRHRRRKPGREEQSALCSTDRKSVV